MDVIDPRQIVAIIDWLLEVYTGKSRAERRILVTVAAQYWPAIERELLRYPGISAREAMNIISETLVGEMRLAQIDLLARAKYARDGERIYESRHVMEQMLEVRELEPIEAHEWNLEGMADRDFVDVG